MKVLFSFIILFLVSIGFFVGCGGSSSSVQDEIENTNVVAIDFKSTVATNNRAAYITSQCYTKTIDDNGNVHNPCFTCHINSEEPNYINDWDLQENNSFSEYSKTNRFTNLFKDRTEAVANISDEEILQYVREDNYKDKDGNLLLSNKLKSLPDTWDINDNGKWDGYIPDCYFNFDSEGFDKDLNGDYTGWRVFGYYPFLGTFWPTNGSTDDVLIRLPKEFQQNENGTFDLEVYKINLAIVESLIKEQDITLESTIDETLYGVDLDQDGNIEVASKVVYNWIKPNYNSAQNILESFSMSYVGLAKEKLVTNEYLIAPGLYPKYTEFLHTVRYIDVNDENNSIQLAKRIKELRYGVKVNWNTYPALNNITLSEIKEKDAFPERLRTIVGNTEEGLQTGLGWVYQGFIEDVNGDLRPQNYEETQYCIGCHSGIGATKDSTFAFQRKFDINSFQKGWYHWTQDSNGFTNIKEPQTKDGRYEYTLYLEQNSAGDEFRANEEVMEKFFDESGALKSEEVLKVRDDIGYLLYPSAQRALTLNKAYKVIVDEQSFIYGRDTHVKPVSNVHTEIDIDTATGVTAVVYE